MKSINLRRKKHLKRKFAAYLLLLLVLIGSILLLHFYSDFGKPLFISPLGKTNINLPAVEKTLKDNHIQYSGIDLSDNSYLINIQNNGQVKISADKDISKQISSLQKILNQLTIEGKSFKSIDFRFAEPIISF